MARCHALVVTDASGRALATLSPSGFGPQQFHGAYALPLAAASPKTIAIVAPLSWDWTMFNDPDEPKLRAELPAYSGFPYTGSILAAGTASFEIHSLSRLSPSAAKSF